MNQSQTPLEIRGDDRPVRAGRGRLRAVGRATVEGKAFVIKASFALALASVRQAEPRITSSVASPAGPRPQVCPRASQRKQCDEEGRRRANSDR